MMTRQLIALCTFFLLGFSVQANPDPTIQRIHDPKTFIETLGQRTISILKDSGLSKSEHTAKLERLFDEYVDTNWMANFVLGASRRTASSAEIQQFEEIYHQFLLKKYMPKFNSYTGEKLQVQNVDTINDQDTMVQTLIVRNNGTPPVHVDYLLRKGTNPNRDPFKVIDIVAEGISLINTHRSEFGSIISQKGMEGFLQVMKERVNNPTANPDSSLTQVDES